MQPASEQKWALSLVIAESGSAPSASVPQARAGKASGTGMCGRNLGHRRVGSGALRLPKGHELGKQPLQRPRDREDQTELGESQVDRPGWSMIRLSCIYYLGFNNPSPSLILFSFLKKTYLFLIGGQLLYNAVLVSAIHQHESAIGIYKSPPF